MAAMGRGGNTSGVACHQGPAWGEEVSWSEGASCMHHQGLPCTQIVWCAYLALHSPAANLLSTCAPPGAAGSQAPPLYSNFAISELPLPSSDYSLMAGQVMQVRCPPGEPGHLLLHPHRPLS